MRRRKQRIYFKRLQERVLVFFLSFLDGILDLGIGDEEEGIEGLFLIFLEEFFEMVRLRGSDV